MEHVVVLRDSLTRAHDLKGCDSVVFINRFQFVHQELRDSLALTLLSQRLAKIIIRRENDRCSTIVAHVSLITDAILPEGRLAKVQDLLWGTTTLDWELGASKNSVASAEAVSQDRRLVGTL